MAKSTGQICFFLWTIFFSCLSAATFGASGNSLDLAARLKAAETMRIENPDSAIQALTSVFADSMKEQDTLIAVQTLTALATVHGNRANYRESYNSLWEALLLADQAQLDSMKVFAYQRIGRYYAFYKRREKALHFINLSLSLNKSMVEEGQMEKASLTRRYMALCSTFLELGELQLAQTYLDSCFYYHQEGVKSSLKRPFIRMQQAFIYTESKRSDEAIRLMEELIPWFETRLPTYLVLVYSYLGDAYRTKGMDTQGELSYQKALTISEDLHSHLDFSVLVHEKLAKLYLDQKQYPKAYQQLEKVLQLDRLIFDSRSEYNRPLLEIQDEFRNAMEAKEQLLKEKRIAQLEHENNVRFLRIIIISVLSGSVILFSILFFYYLRNKYQVEKQLINLEMKANKELLELKNKELATATLKLFEKDKFLTELKNRIAKQKENISHQEINHLLRTATIGNVDTWKAFEAQFVSVNNQFFEKLGANFPTLTHGEKRLCALIKLKLTSKEIAGLMRISVESVHKSRYRLRKKLNLDKGMDLTDYVSRIN